jgi:uncharacterized protein (DUF1800 family)
MPARSPAKRRPAPAALPVYRGAFTPSHAERLLWRAGFGPRPGEAEALARLGLRGAVRSLTRPASVALVGPEPRVDGAGLAPGDAWGHELLWWLDRMVRTRAPLTERMTLVWHDWFATSIRAVEPRLALAQNRTLRKHALGSFPALFTDLTRDPAMLMWLNGNENAKGRPNENYAREMLELFALGAGRGYGERDVRELARALTGFRNDWSDGGPRNFRFDADEHDGGVKTVFGHKGRFGWRDAVRLAVDHPKHPSYLARRLWEHFIPVAPSKRDVAVLGAMYRASGGRVRALVEAILEHPALHEGPRMVKPPAVYVAGLLRAVDRGVDTDAWTWISELTGQRLFEPPNVSGWAADRWIDTATWRGRWIAANEALDGRTLDPEDEAALPLDLGPAGAVDRALATLGTPTLTPQTRAALEAFAAGARARADKPWEVAPFGILRHNALLMLIATSPDYHTS